MGYLFKKILHQTPSDFENFTKYFKKRRLLFSITLWFIHLFLEEL
jgi:hypothetical protein